MSFRLSLIAAVQPTGGKSFAPLLSWTPTYTVQPQIKIAMDLGVTRLTTSAGGSFNAIEYGVLASYLIEPEIALEGGLGVQTWLGDGGGSHGVMASANILRMLTGAGLLKGFFGGYSTVFLSSFSTSIIRFGIFL
jgi:hypothetical protein